MVIATNVRRGYSFGQTATLIQSSLTVTLPILPAADGIESVVWKIEKYLLPESGPSRSSVCETRTKPLRGMGAPIPRLWVVDRSARQPMLRSEAIRLIFRQELHHEFNDTNDQSVASTLS